MNIHQYVVYLMNMGEIITHTINCANEDSAKNICEEIYPNHRVIEIQINI